MNHAVYSLYNSDILENSNNCGVGRGVRFESNGKMRTSPLIELSKEEIDVSCSLSQNTTVISAVASAELTRVQAKVKFDLKVQEVQEIDYLGNYNA